MKTRLNAFFASLLSFFYTCLSNPQRVRFIVTVLVIVIILAALLVPTAKTLADFIGGGGS
jgi:hypothetical protein